MCTVMMRFNALITECLCEGVTNGCSSGNGGCEQLCLLGHDKAIVCECSSGYQLASNRRSCTSMHCTSHCTVLWCISWHGGIIGVGSGPWTARICAVGLQCIEPLPNSARTLWSLLEEMNYVAHWSVFVWWDPKMSYTVYCCHWLVMKMLLPDWRHFVCDAHDNDCIVTSAPYIKSYRFHHATQCSVQWSLWALILRVGNPKDRDSR